jgi:hypothetical protein
MRKFAEDEIVVLLEDNPDLELKAGDRGTIFCYYDDTIQPQLYEVVFCLPDGTEFQYSICEYEIGPVIEPNS